MTEKLKKKIKSLTKKLALIPNGTNKHFTFFVQKNKIISLGWNDYTVTHPLCKTLGYEFELLHSEVSAIVRYRGDPKVLKSCKVINTRINTCGKFGMSKPCEKCQAIIDKMGFKNVFFTNFNGEFEKAR